MYIEKLRIQNFKQFKDIELSFSSKVTILAGTSLEKASVLEAIAIAISTMLVKIDGVSGKSIDKTQVRSQERYPVTISATAALNLGKKVSWTRSLNKPMGRTTTSDSKDIIQYGALLQSGVRTGDTSLILPIIAYYSKMRSWGYQQEETYSFERNSRLNGYISCVDGRPNVRLMMNWFMKMTIQKYQNEELGLSDILELKAVYQAMETIYSKITGQEGASIHYSIVTRDLLVKSKEGAQTPVSQLDSGLKDTICLVADIACRAAMLNPQLLDNVCKETDGVILIDEVDQQHQKHIINGLTDIFPNVQFIISYHSTD